MRLALRCGPARSRGHRRPSGRVRRPRSPGGRPGGAGRGCIGGPCSTRWASTTWRCSSLTVSGSCPVACTITAACPGETKPGVERCRGGVVARSRGRLASATWRAASDRDTVVVLATQASVSVNPASCAVPALSAAATSFSLSASIRRIARSTSATTGCSPAGSRTAERRAAGRAVRAPRPPRTSTGCGVGVEVEECCHGLYSFSNTCSSQELESRMWTTKMSKFMDRNHSGRVKRR